MREQTGSQDPLHNTASDTDLHGTLERGAGYLLGSQQADGHWVGEMEGDTILESEYILMMRILGNGDAVRLSKAAEFIRRKQLPEGGWAIYPGGPQELSASVKACFALKLTGANPDAPFMRSAREAITDLGGAGLCNSYTRFYLAALGQMDWDKAPAVPPEITLLPPWFYFNLYAISSWSRTFVVPLSIIWAHKPVVQVPSDQGIAELFTQECSGGQACGLMSWRRFFLTVDKVIKSAERTGIHPWRSKALQAAESWMLERSGNSAGLGAIYPPMVYALIALRCLGYPDDHPSVVRAREELESLAIEDEETLRFQPCKSPVWDTAIAVNALRNAGVPVEGVELTKSAEWLLSKEVRSRGDWSVRRPDVEPGGWYFEYANEPYPDIDDTAMVLLALKGVSPTRHQNMSGAARRALDWILAMQGQDGGWASFDVDNDRQVLCSIPFADHNAMIDPSTADITGRVIEMLAAYGFDRSHRQVARAVEYLLRHQESDGSWFGRWGVNYVYGTMQVLRGLSSVGVPREHRSIVGGVSWLLRHQNPDGGWGESIQTYDKPSERGKGPSTASQTAWAVMGLIAAGQADNSATKAGADFLIRTQNPDGSWDEDQWTGTGFPKVFYLKYHLYRQSFPVWALGLYAESRAVSRPETESGEIRRMAA